MTLSILATLSTRLLRKWLLKHSSQEEGCIPNPCLGFVVEHEKEVLLVLHPQHADLRRHLNQKYIDCDALRSVRGQLLFISHSCRSNISNHVLQLCQVKYDNAKYVGVRFFNHAVKHLQKAKDWKLRYCQLDSKSLKLYIFGDSGYNTNVHLITNLGMIISLVDDTNHRRFLQWASYRSQRVTEPMFVAKFTISFKVKIIKLV